MQQKKRMYRHLSVIYIIYFVALILGTSPHFIAGFADSYRQATSEGTPDRFAYVVKAPLDINSSHIEVEGLPENISPSVARLCLMVSTDEEITWGSSFRTFADSPFAFSMLWFATIASLAILVLFALIINSLRKSIRDEQPVHHANIVRTRWIGGLIILTVLCDSIMQTINAREAARLLADTPLHVLDGFQFDYWNFIIGLLFIFMGEVFSISSQLSEEQKFTI